MKNRYLFAAGVLSAITALIHTIGGQLDLVTDLLASNMDAQAQAEWLGVWHMVTVLLFAFAYYLLKAGRTDDRKLNIELLHLLALLSFLFGAVFLLVSILREVFAPQFVLIIPIGILILLGIRDNLLD